MITFVLENGAENGAEKCWFVELRSDRTAAAQHLKRSPAALLADSGGALCILRTDESRYVLG
ncbi:MAG: hypothetical protein MK538_11290 [Planctomycetes bacterium]|nr:hypothetical protein [Planctomycetota bacterium]